MARLAVNIDHVATLRQARGGVEPDPILAACIAEVAGAEGIICHLREDRRHVQDRDLRLLREVVKTKLNLEMAPVDEMVEIALSVCPDIVTLVPERRRELTTEGGLDVIGGMERYQKLVERLHRGKIRVSFFVEPNPDQVMAAKECGGDIVEIHTGHYAEARTEDEIEKRFRKIEVAVKSAFELGLGVSAGHGLNYVNIKRFKQLPEVEEYSIGHSIVARAVIVGFERAVRDMVEIVRGF